MALPTLALHVPLLQEGVSRRFHCTGKARLFLCLLIGLSFVVVLSLISCVAAECGQRLMFQEPIMSLASMPAGRRWAWWREIPSRSSSWMWPTRWWLGVPGQSRERSMAAWGWYGMRRQNSKGSWEQTGTGNRPVWEWGRLFSESGAGSESARHWDKQRLGQIATAHAMSSSAIGHLSINGNARPTRDIAVQESTDNHDEEWLDKYPLYSSAFSGTLDGQYWLELFEDSSNEEEFGNLVERVPERDPADVEISTVSALRRRLLLRMPEADRVTQMEIGEFDREADVFHNMWPASVAAAAWMARMEGSSAGIAGDVLELGSGVGVFGLAAGAKIAAASMRSDADSGQGSLMLSELSEDLIPHLRQTLSDNALLLEGLMSIDARVLNWNTTTTPGFSPLAQYDHIVAADCLYESQHATTLVAATLTHLKEGGSAYLVVPVRDGLELPEALKSLELRGKVTKASAVLIHKVDGPEKTTGMYPMELIVFQKAKRSLPGDS